MKIKLEYKRINISFSDNLFMSIVCDYTQLIGSWNWITFTFLKLEIEKESYTGGIEFELVVLGLGFWIRWNYNPKKLEKLLKDSDKEIEQLRNTK